MNSTPHDKCRSWIRERVKLTNFDSGLWNYEHDNVIDAFLSSTSCTALFAFINKKDNQLILSLKPPSMLDNAIDVAYFVVPKGSKIYAGNLNDIIQFGTFSTTQTPSSVMHIIESTFFPFFFSYNEWPKRTNVELRGQYHHLMTSLREQANIDEGKTILYLPFKKKEIFKIRGEESYTECREFLQHLEYITVCWTKLIKSVVNACDQVRHFDSAGPVEEIGFWRSRVSDLSSLVSQLKSDDVNYILDILKKKESSHVPPLTKLKEKIEEGLIEAMDNIKFLNIISSTCDELAQSKPNDITQQIPTLLRYVRFISKFSKFYNSKERISCLLRKISNEIVNRCKETISIQDMLDGNIEDVIKTIQDCIQCINSWKIAYQTVSKVIDEDESIIFKWDFDGALIFAQLEAFLQRCHDLMDICDSQLQFVQKKYSNCGLNQAFKYINNKAILKGIIDIEVNFLLHIDRLKKLDYNILDIQKSKWHEDFKAFKTAVKDMEVMFINIINASFEQVQGIGNAITLLQTFKSIARRESILRCMQNKEKHIHILFVQYCSALREQFDSCRRNPPLRKYEPKHAGAALWAQSLLDAVNEKWRQMKTLNSSHEIHDIDSRSSFEKIGSTLIAFRSQRYKDWKDSLSTTNASDILQRLDQPLLKRIVTNSSTIKRKIAKPTLESNLDSYLSSLFCEVHYWEKLRSEEFEIPNFILGTYQQAESLRVLYEQVMSIVRIFNELIEDLSEEELNLFSDHLRVLEKRILPGLTKLKWSSRALIIQRFVQVNTMHALELHEIVRRFHQENKSIHRVCNEISTSVFVKMEKNGDYDYRVFIQNQAKHRMVIGELLKNASDKIIKSLKQMKNCFVDASKEVRHEWGCFIDSTNTAIEKSLQNATRYSLLKLARAINGGMAGNEFQTLFLVKVLLKNERIECQPSVINITNAINIVAKELVGTIKLFPYLDRQVEIHHGDNADLSKRNSFYDNISKSNEVLRVVVQIMNGVAAVTSNVRAQLSRFDIYKHIWEMDKDAFLHKYEKANHTSETFESDISRFSEQQISIENVESQKNVQFLSLRFSSLKSCIVSQVSECRKHLLTLLHSNTKEKLQEIHGFFHKQQSILCMIPTDLLELKNMIDCVKMTQSQLQMLQDNISKLELAYKTLGKFDFAIDEYDRNLLIKLRPIYDAFLETVTRAERIAKKKKKDMRVILDKSISKHQSEKKIYREKFVSLMMPLTSLSIENVISKKTLLYEAIQGWKIREEKLKPGLELFSVDLPGDKALKNCELELKLIEEVWKIASDWDRSYKGWTSELFLHVNMEKLEIQCSSYSKLLNKLKRDISSWDIWIHLRQKIDCFKQTLPAIYDLKCDAFRKRHWNLLKQSLGENFESDPNVITLRTIFSLNLHRHQELISDLASDANKELNVEVLLSDLESRWEEIDVDIKPYKSNYFKISSTDDLMSSLEDDSISIATVKLSKCYSVFKNKIDYWDNTFSLISEVLEVMLAVQRKWLYLESIFLSGGDICKQLPQEHATFETVHKLFVNTMRHSARNPKAIEVCSMDPVALNEISNLDEKLEKIQKSLDQYLEMKRMLFPRFYFVSDDDLLEILGKSKDPLEVQKHIKKCFEGVHTMIIDEKQKGSSVISTSGVMASDKEALYFSEKVKLEGPVEIWLETILKAMRLGVKISLHGAICDNKGKKKEERVNKWQGQVLITSGAIAWTLGCTKALHSIESGKNKHALRMLKKKQKKYLKKLTELVRDPNLNNINRSKTVALITMEIHNRDVIERLIKRDCNDPQSFTWLSQLRFNFDVHDGQYGECKVQQTNCTLPYSYEYQGNNGRLVVTPLTDRCILTLLTAMYLNRGGNPLGPAGTGKTETVKDLAKNVGQYCVVSNCSDGMDYKSVGRIFSGLCQSGCWGCFDEFNRIKIEVISVVAMQVLSILDAQRTRQDEFLFMGSMIPCSTNTGIFITMNPGYAGRTELPDNLKALMRPVAMMAPDLNLIAEVMLAAEGFVEARTLAKKTITLYSLMQQQLSKQDHYDYGLRNLKAVLSMAGSLKRQDVNRTEELILLKALKDMNLPKFIKEDLALFMLLLNDLFPGLELPMENCNNLKAAVERDMLRSGLQNHKKLVENILQLHNSQLTRHCNMLVGSTMSGKSVAWKTLAAAKIAMLNEDHDVEGCDVSTYILNPKCVTLSELYGEYDLQTFEWEDGILSTIFKKCSESEKKDEKWIIFDGPIDAMWIESMNSVMDDNKILTLINGDRIPLTDSMALVFEVEDLSVASPATVSRAGMIFFEGSDLGWELLASSWLQKKFVDSANEFEFHKALFDKYVQKILNYKRSSCVEPVPINDINAVQSLITLYDSMLFPLKGYVKRESFDTNQYYQSYLEKCFVFCVVWSLMSAVDERGRILMDQYFREIESIFPPNHSVYDYYLDGQKRDFELWERKVTSLQPTYDLGFQQIFVPTIDTTRTMFILSEYMMRGHQVLLTGNTGLGKTRMVQTLLKKLPNTHSSLQLNFSSATSSGATQRIIENSMQKRGKDKMGPLANKRLVIFIDDFNLPKKTSSESPFQPPLELIRMFMDYNGWYDRKKCSWQHVLDSQICGAMAPPGGGREIISQRIQSSFRLFNFAQPTDPQIIHIFQAILLHKFNSFESEIQTITGPLVNATLHLYKLVQIHFLPTPSKFYYLFNLRDITKVVQGLYGIQQVDVKSKKDLIRFWTHECMRSFSDRFINDQTNDETRFIQLIDKTLNKYFEIDWCHLMKKSIDQDLGPIYVDFANSKKHHEEVQDYDTLQRSLLEKLEDYNSESRLVPMNLVLFRDAMRHICRIYRVLQFERGNMILIGVGGSGRNSLAKLASYVAGIKFVTIEVTNQYRTLEFREDLKKMFHRCGIDNERTVFLFSDTQIKDEMFLEDVSNFLTSGEVPNIFQKDEVSNIIDEIRQCAVEEGYDDVPDILWNFFLERVRRNLHVILTMSPVGNSLRKRSMMFPSIINCTHINYFNEWPQNALQEVALKYLRDVGLCKNSNLSLYSKVSDSFASFHLSAIELSEKMKIEQKRFNYITPTNYLELVKGYLELLKEKQMELGSQQIKLTNGLDKLERGREQVETMSVELERKKLIVASSQQKCEDMLKVIILERKMAETQKIKVQAESLKIENEECECKEIASDAEADLAIALPALEKAMIEVEKLDKNSITEIKGYAKPPPAVEKVLSCVMTFLGKPIDWASAKKVLGETSFLSGLKSFDKANVKESILIKVKKFISSPTFAAEETSKISKAAGALCFWCHAIYTYAGVSREVAPKRARLKAAQESLKVKQDDLSRSQKALEDAIEEVEDLKRKYESSVDEKNMLKREAEDLEEKLIRAKKLINGLGGEYTRWQKSIIVFEKCISVLVGDVLLASAFLSYAGPFDILYREFLVQKWKNCVNKAELPVSGKFDFFQFLGKSTDIRAWNNQGLPTDVFSTENGVIVNRCRRWPLLVDPQGQANKWIKNMEGEQLVIVNLKMNDFLRLIEAAIINGLPVLLQEILEEIDPSLEPILTKSTIKVGNRFLIKVGDKEVDYNKKFRLYLSTKLSNPHFTPEISTKTTVINFAVKQQGLEDQLLGIVVNKERPKLESQKNELTLCIASNNKKLVELEDDILKKLAESKGSLLNNIELVQTLQDSKLTAEKVEIQLRTAKETESNINEARERYREAAVRASIAYLVLNDMSKVDPMYKYSLDSYIDLFEKSIQESRKGYINQNNEESAYERVQQINKYHTQCVYKWTCIGLFERHKLLFSLQLCFKIMKQENSLPQKEFNFFCHGGIAVDRAQQSENQFAWINDVMWDHFSELGKILPKDNFMANFYEDHLQWEKWYSSSKPEEANLPGIWEKELTSLQKMCIIRALRPDRTLFAATNFISNNIGTEFAESPQFDLLEIYNSSTPRTPLIFILSPGVDPTEQIQQLAMKAKINFLQVALGQGQGPIAIKAVKNALREGSWVFLSNCHLMLSWMMDLDKLVEEYCEQDDIHENYRLWLSSSPNPRFPMSLLQRGIKMTTEPPRGLRANLMKLYALVQNDKFHSCQQPSKYKKLLFSLSWFHALLLERRKFKTLGFNIPYEFNESDFMICHDLIIVFLNEYKEKTPFEALKYLIGEANYGGRVTEDMDRRLVNVYMDQLFCESAIEQDNFLLSELKEYHIPNDGTLKSYVDYIRKLPYHDNPKAFGQHPNADISSQIEDSNDLFSTITSLQSTAIVDGVETKDDQIQIRIDMIYEKLPQPFDLERVKSIMEGRMDPGALKSVLYQELMRYNSLISRMSTEIDDVKKTVLGETVVTPHIEIIINEMLEHKVPSSWSMTYPSCKPLGPWLRDLELRIAQMKSWINDGIPPVFWLSGFTYPSGFLTGILQTTARNHGIAIDNLSWEFFVLDKKREEITEGPKEGVYMSGIYLEGAKWDNERGSLTEPNVMELSSPMPIIYFKPIEGKKKGLKNVYSCPLYMYPIRTGSRERPSFVLNVDLESGDVVPEHWVKRGVALLLSTSD